VQHQQELSQHHNLHEVHHQSSPSPSRVSSSIPRSPISELSHRSPSPCSLAGSSSSLRADQPLLGFSSRLLCIAIVANVYLRCESCSGALAAAATPRAPRHPLLLSESRTFAPLVYQISRESLFLPRHLVQYL
jgi:hypothetical protein